MNAEQKLSHKEISKRILTGMGLVYDLFNEMNSFFQLIKDALCSKLDDIVLLSFKKRGFILPGPKKRKRCTAADDYVQTDMGFMAQIGVGGVDDDESGNEEAENGPQHDTKGVISIMSDSQFLAVRAILYDAERAKEGSFDPVVVGAVLSTLSRFPRGKKKTAGREKGKAKGDKQFHLKPGNFSRVWGLLEPTLKSGQEISWNIKNYRLSAMVDGLVSRPLVAFDTEQEFNAFVRELISMAENA